MPKDSGAERRAQKADRRAQNIRRHFPNDPAAERRAQKAERRAHNIRTFADNPSTPHESSGGSSGGDSSNEWIAGCVVAVLVLGGIAWLIQTVVDWFQGLV